MSDVRDRIKSYILDEFLPGEDPSNLMDSTPLVTGGILDSLATLKLVAFLEDSFRIRLAAHEADAQHLDTISKIAELVRTKQQA